ncbi:piggyBac transposable element-derived protein 4-like [Trachinotus anak]|uniref:piggyBac transposable element-derived protein 4-like n=1 Tax=Trachinotus anak TaxID=443729 RepID=UPI0039F1A606
MAAETDKVEPADSEQDEVEDVYEVERIIDMRVEEGDVLYRVRWKNYCSDDDTWEPEAHLEDCREVLSALKKSLADAKLKTEAEVKKNVKLLPAKSDVFDADSESDSDKDRPVEAPIKKKKKILQEDDEPPPKDKRKKKRKGKQMEGVRPAPETDEEEEERAPTPPSTPKEKKTDSKKRLVDSEEDNDDGVPSKKNKKEKGKEGGKYKKEKGEDGKKKKGKKVRKIKTMEDYLSDPSESQMDNTTSSKTAKTVTKSIEKASLYDRFTQKKGRWEVKLQCIKDLIYDNKSKKPDTAQKESRFQKLKSLTSKSKDENAPHSDSSDSSTLHKKVKSKGQESTSALPKVPSSTTSSSSSSSVTAAVNTSVKVKEEDPTGSTNLFEKCLLNCEAKDRAPHHQPVPQPPAEKNNNKPTEMALRPVSAAEASQQSDDDWSFSDESGEDSEEERRNFKLRTDPAEDVSDEDWENIAPARKKAQCQPSEQPQSWKMESDGDAAPPPLEFLPARGPGVQLSPKDNYTPLDLFKLFFSEDAVKTLCRNTNKQAAKEAARGAKYKWTDVGVTEFYKYIGLIFYMAMIKLDSITDYWRKNSIFSVPFPSQVMSRDRYRTISWNIHMSDPDDHRANDAKRRSSEHDRLFRVKPLMGTIQDACKAHYHPRRSLTVHEQYLRTTPNKCRYKLFVLTDSSNGYTVDLNVYAGKKLPSDQGICYDSAMSVIDRRFLGTGYHVYMDSFHTSPKLFMDLFACKFGACGTYRESRKNCPRSTVNALTKTAPRGTYRWIRDGPLLFVKWMDTDEVSVCSTVHTAYTGDVVQRRVKSRRGGWTTKSFPCPSPVMEYNKFMGGEDSPDQLIQYYTTQHKTLKWYKKVFLHFLDIAATNAYILHKELKQQDSMTHKAFMEELTAQLCGVTQKNQRIAEDSENNYHLPVPGVEVVNDSRMRASAGRKTCAYCRTHRGKHIKTPWKCKACDVHLCLQVDRNCFEAWHPDQMN